MMEDVAIQRRNSTDKPTTTCEANDTKSNHLNLTHQVASHSEPRKADQLTFFGFAPLRKRLNGHAVGFLMDHLRWAKPEDPPEVVGKKNVIIMFTIHTEIEDCLVQNDQAKPLGLQRLL